MAMQSPNKNHKEHNFPADAVEEEMLELVTEILPVPPRSSEKSARTRARFMAELDAAGLPERQPARAAQLSGSWLRFLPFARKLQNKDDKENDMSAPVQRFAFSTVILFALVAALLFGGAGSTVAASSNAIPGDALYGVKTTLEQTRASLAGSAGDRAELYLEFADRRMDEIARLIDQGRYDEVAGTTDVYENYLNLAIAEIQTVAQSDPQRAALLAAEVTASLNRYAQALSRMVDSVPAAVKDDVQRALQTTRRAGGVDDDSASDDGGISGDDSSQDEIEFTGEVTEINGELWTIGGTQFTVTALTEMKDQIALGSLVKVHAFRGTSGALVVREIELTGAGVDDDDLTDDQDDDRDDDLNDDQDDDLDDDRDDASDDDSGDDDSPGGNSGPSMSDDDDSSDDSGSGSDGGSDDSGDDSDDDSDDDSGDDSGDDDSGGSDDSGDDDGDDD